MQADNPSRMAVQALDFGATGDTPVVNFVSAIDLDKSIIRIPYVDFEISVKSLIENYLEITSCREKFLKRPFFKIINGMFKGEIAVDTFKISGMNLRLQEVCFEILDEASLQIQGLLAQTTKKVQRVNKTENIRVVVTINGKNVEMMINLKDTVWKLKNLLVGTRKEFASYAAEIIRLQYNGLHMSNDKLMGSYNISADSKIMAFVCRKQGCFSAGTLVSCPNNTKKPISSLKKGDQVMSFNITTKQLEVDIVTHSLCIGLDQYIQIRFEDGTSIETTTNHTFLCENMSWKKVDAAERSPQKLAKGCRLWREETSAVVTEISTKSVPKKQNFYHLSIKENHNFLVEGIVAHNMFINIRFSDITEKIDINPSQHFLEVKKVMERTYHIDRLNMRLMFAGMQIRDDYTASDKNIGKDATLNLITRLSKKKVMNENGESVIKNIDLGYSYLHPDTMILMGDNTYKQICQIKIGDKVISFDTRTRKILPNSSVVLQINQFQVKDFCQIYLDSGQKSIIMSSDSFLELANGEAIHIKDLLNEYSESGRPYLQKFEQGIVRAHAISPDSMEQRKKFYRLTLDNNENYVAEDVIIHSSVITLLSIFKENKGNRIRYGVDRKTQISEIKQKLAKSIGLAPAKQIFTFQGGKIPSQKSFMDLDICNEHVIVVSQVQKTIPSLIMIDEQQDENLNEKKITLQISETEKITILYVIYADKTIQEIMKELLPSNKSTYFFLFSDLVLMPEQKLREIQLTIEFKLSELTIIVVKNEKFVFVQKQICRVENPKIVLKEPKQQAKCDAFLKAVARISMDLSQEERFISTSFFYPFLYLTYGDKTNQLNKCVRGLQVETQDRDFTQALYFNMQIFPNFYGDCCLGMKNFKFSRFFSVQQVFYFHNFTIAHKRQRDVLAALKGKSGTLFYITSISGKEIERFSLYPEDQEILFSPYSYFIVQKIEESKAMDKVWLKQMPSPSTFKKNIVLWVDDNPDYNIDLIKRIPVDNLEIIQVTSTIMAEKWIKQFGWLLKWEGLDFKLISDMVRVEGPNRIHNYQAGLDLVDILYVKHGITAKTLIYCGDEHKAKMLTSEHMLESKYLNITQHENVLLNFVRDFK